MLATSLYRHGAMTDAEAHYRAVLQARPGSSQARVQLAEALLQQRRYAEAALESANIAHDDPFAGLAARIELWSRIAGGDLDGAQTAAARAARLGVSQAERELFAAWLELASPGQDAEPRALPIASTPLLGVILETLLRAQDFETFELLTKLLRNSALPQREQRELLASMYLDQGFLPLAAQEWMAVCESRPDARALVGLARVAQRHGQPEDAAVFAGEALELDPVNSAARELQAALAA
jgi:Tfp pilus assembly protein PilF